MARQANANAQGCGWIAAIGLLAILVGKCGGVPTPSVGPEPQASPTASVSTPGYVAARSLRCRATPTANGVLQESLGRADQVTIIGREGDWSKLSRPSGDCYVTTAFLTDVRPTTDGNTTGAASSSNGTNRALGIAAIGGGITYATHRAATRHARSSRYSRRSSRRTQRTYGYDYGSGCPCSGGTVCIGARGGRYCITSGGNKRYGV